MCTTYDMHIPIQIVKKNLHELFSGYYITRLHLHSYHWNVPLTYKSDKGPDGISWMKMYGS